MNSFKWSSNLAYVVGLMATDGNLSKDGRHLDLTSKDIEQLENFKKCLNLKNKIGWKSSGYSKKRYPRIQFGDVKLYRWFEKIGLHSNKTKTIGRLKIPDKYFFDFLRGSFDGDGCTYSYWDPRWKSSFVMYLQFVSASEYHLKWINEQVSKLTGNEGKIRKITRAFRLVFAKKGAKEIITKFYKNPNCIYLLRKKDKIDKALEEECRDGGIGYTRSLEVAVGASPWRFESSSRHQLEKVKFDNNLEKKYYKNKEKYA